LANSGCIFLEFLKVIEEKTKEKNLTANCDSKEYEKNRTRKCSVKWQVGRPWIQHHDKGMICECCIENKQTLVAQNALNSTTFINGCTGYKAESIS